MFRFPWGDFHSLNLGWFLQKFNELLEDWATAEAGIDGALDAEIQKAEDALTDVFAARDAAAASASAANSSASNASQSSLASMDARDQSKAARDAAQQAAGNAAASETAARNSATAASNSAGAAATSATQAGNSATAAGNSATAAGNSATAAAGSATAAEGSATAAAGSATAAAGSATAAGQSAEDAENAASSVQASTEQIAINARNISDITEYKELNLLHVGGDNYERCGIYSNGKVIGYAESVGDFTVYYARCVKDGKYKIKANETPIFVAFFYEPPVLGLVSYNESRDTLTADNNIITAPIDGYIAFRSLFPFNGEKIEVNTAMDFYARTQILELQAAVLENIGG